MPIEGLDKVRQGTSMDRETSRQPEVKIIFSPYIRTPTNLRAIAMKCAVFSRITLQTISATLKVLPSAQALSR